MNRITALLPLFACACATVPTPDPVIPAQLDLPRAQQLYDAYRLVCKEGSCQQNGETNPIISYERTRLDMPRVLLTSNRRLRNTISWIFFGTSIASAVGGGLAFFDLAIATKEHPDLKTAAIGLASGAAGSLLVGVLIRTLWPEPTQNFETAYNRALKLELDRRLAGDPTAMAAPRALTDREKACILERSRPGTLLFSNLKISACVQKQ